MRWRHFIPGTSTLVLLFQAADQRLTEQTDHIADLPDARIVSATEEMHQIANDIRDAQPMSEASSSTVRTPGIRADERPN
jgi:hypothetical protein